MGGEEDEELYRKTSFTIARCMSRYITDNVYKHSPYRNRGSFDWSNASLMS